MGKQSRKKQQKNKNKNAALGKITSENAAKKVPSGPSSALISRIRHGDARLRHGSLAALSSTLFDPESLSSSCKKKEKKNGGITLELLQALAERIMDNDMPCAMCAAGCISNYVLFSNDEEEIGESTGGLLSPILLGKIEKSCGIILKLGVDLTNATTKMHSNEAASSERDDEKMNDKKSKKQKEEHKKKSPAEKILASMMEHWYVISLCLHALCGLIEGSVATNQDILASLLSEVMGNENLLTILLKVMFMGAEMLTKTSTTFSISEEGQKTLSDTLIYSSRTLHAALDENKVLISSLLETKLGFDADINAMQFILTYMENSTLPSMARLHCAGIIVTVRNMLPNIGKKDSSGFVIVEMDNTAILSKVVPLLHQYLDYRPDIAAALWNRVSETNEKMKAEVEDEKMEKEIVNKVEKRKESARSICRRQKAMKDAAAKATSDSMGEDKNTPDSKTQNTSSLSPQEDKLEQYEKALDSWSNACLPLKLAIEITTNLCAGSGSNQSDGLHSYEDDEGEMWDDVMEAKLMSSSQSTPEKSDNDVSNSWDVRLLSNVQTSGIPDRILSLFGAVILSAIKCRNETIVKIVIDDLMEILSKSSSCLCNILSSVTTWKCTEEDASAVWKELCSAIQNAIQTKELDKLVTTVIPFVGITAITGVMLAFARHRPLLLNTIGEQELTLVLDLVKSEKPTTSIKEENDDVEAFEEFQHNAVATLGIFSTQPHSDEVNATICDALLKTLCLHSTGAAVMSEILNVLMDIYGAYDDDDPNSHCEVFGQKNVLNYFQKSISVLKKKILEEEIRNKGFDELEMWKETVLNAKRFVKYKKGQL